MDHHVPRAVTNGLRLRGVDLLRVSIGDCVRDLEVIVQVGEPEDITGQTLFLPLQLLEALFTC